VWTSGRSPGSMAPRSRVRIQVGPRGSQVRSGVDEAEAASSPSAVPSTIPARVGTLVSGRFGSPISGLHVPIGQRLAPASVDTGAWLGPVWLAGPSPYDTLIRDSLPVDWRSLRTRMELSSLLRSHRTLGPHNDLRVATRCDGVCEPMHQWGWSRQTRDGEGGRKRTSHRSDASRPLGEAPGTLGGVVIQ